MYSHCRQGGWVLGHTIDGTQAEFVRIPHADTSLYVLPQNANEEAYAMLSDILPTGFECGVLDGKVKPGDTVAIVGAGPVGLAALLTAQLYSPSEIVMVDLDAHRLEVARALVATRTVAATGPEAVAKILEMTGGAGVDVAIEAVGVPVTFDVCQSILAAGGHLANVGVHGAPVDLHLEMLWHHNVTLTTRLVDTVTTPMLLKMIAAGRLDPGKLVTHRFALTHVMRAYDTFSNAASECALNVILRARAPMSSHRRSTFCRGPDRATVPVRATSGARPFIQLNSTNRVASRAQVLIKPFSQLRARYVRSPAAVRLRPIASPRASRVRCALST